MLSPARSITFCRGWCLLLLLWVVAIGDDDVALMLGVLSLIVAMCWLGSWLGIATSSSFLLVLVSRTGGRWWLLAVVVTWQCWVVVDNGGGGGTTNCVYCLFIVCGAKSNVSVCRESTWTIYLLTD